MTVYKKKEGASGARVAAIVVSMSASLFICWNFAEAVADGLTWKRTSDWALIAPNLEAPDAKSAKIVPDFTLKDRFGNEVRLSQFAPADLLIVNLWSSGCPPCAREIPSLAELDRRLPTLGKVALVTITIDEKWEDVTSMFPHGTDLRVLFDPEKKVVEGIFETTKFPETFILDNQRRIRARFDGERTWHSPEMMKYIASFK
ncbi:MAG: TlpA family protein disulfide reductase [Deltaproteobacteria bacterium]|nr:TlpA family protein disulfide reductase [Deltaproteobacteria bacterium]